jgi:hypothetical protein
MATLLAGVGAYLMASYGDFAYPFLASLAVAIVTYGAGSILERRA